LQHGKRTNPCTEKWEKIYYISNIKKTKKGSRLEVGFSVDVEHIVTPDEDPMLEEEEEEDEEVDDK
jgi:hypothetical protein